MRAWLAVVAAFTVAVAVAAAAWYLMSPTPRVGEAPVVVAIPAQDGVRDVARRLQAAGAVRSSGMFTALAVVRGSARRLHAGEYELPQGATTLEVLRLLESGRVRVHAVLHPEGATVEELARVLDSQGLAVADDVLRVARDPVFLRAQGIAAPTAEGYLFPDTYHWVRGMRPEDILGRMVQQLRARLGPDITARAAARGLTLHELLTLASVIEREAAAPEERRLISGVFWNRLKREMPLQADPTVQYAVGKGRRALTRADLEVDHPFNTYRNPGLPPGPIASPGLESIQAALDPATVPYLYFVKLDDRRHHFSSTLAEHNAAVARYRLVRSR